MQSFSSKTRLRHHRTHTKPFHCVTCRKSFGRPTLLEKHKRTHTNEKPFPCTICEMSFRQKGHLTRHNQSQVHSIRKKLKEHEQIKRNENESLRLLIGSIQQYLASLAHPILLQQGNGSQSNEKASKVGSFNAASCEGSRYQEAQTPAKQSGQNSIPCDLLVPYLDRIKQLADRMTIAEVAVTKKTDTIPTDRRVDMARQAAHRALVQYLRCLQGQE
jgi:hypothetical protein